jgi:hypothetical protein
MILFKYRDDSERTEDIIKNKKVWLSAPAQLNDPLECRIGEIPKAWEEKTIHTMEEAQLMGVVAPFPTFAPPKRLFSLNEHETKKWIKRLNKISHQQRMTAMRELYSRHGIELSRPAEIFNDMRKRLSAVGVFSLSEVCDSELMWAHYGANHQGLVIGFERTTESRLADTRHCIPVTYSKTKPTFDAGFTNEVQIFAHGSGTRNVTRVSFEDEVFRSTISTKTPVWDYEKEWRYVEETHGLFNFPAPVTKIVFGLKMKPERRAHYMQIAKQFIGSRINFFEATEKPSLSGLDIKPAAQI